MISWNFRLWIEKESAPKSGNVAARAPPIRPAVSSNVFGSNVHNCNINISPQNLSVNVCNGPTHSDALLHGTDLDTLHRS